MQIKSLGKKEIKEVPWGVYLWQMPDGSFVADDEGHFWMLASLEGDQKKMKIMKDSVRSEFGIVEGKPCFFSGHRIVSDEEYEYQRQRLGWGLEPHPLDMSSINEAKND